MNLRIEHTFLEMVLKLLLFPLPNLTNLPLPCKLDMLRWNILNFNHLQFQDTRMYLVKSMGLFKIFFTLQSSYDCTLLWDWSIFKRPFKVHTTTHTSRGLFKVIVWLRLRWNIFKKVGSQTNLELVPTDSLIEILPSNLLALCHNQYDEVLIFMPNKKNGYF